MEPIRDHRWLQPVSVKGRFANDHNELPKSVLLPSAYMYLVSSLTRRTDGIAALAAWNAAPRIQRPTRTGKMHITWIGHASFMLEYEGFRILLDPVFHHATWLFRRHVEPGIQPHALPHIDAVLISHNHRDHLEQHTMQHLSRQHQSMMLVPSGDGYWMKRWNITTWRECTWWESHTWHTTQGTPITATFVPAHHWSQRGLFDRNRSLWGGWIITTPESTCYFAGDTAYSSHFHAIAERFPTIDTALMPIGPCEPTRWMRVSHLSAEEAGRACIDLKAQRCVPMHWGTFGFGIDQPLAPLHRFESWWYANGDFVTPEQLCALKMGESLTS